LDEFLPTTTLNWCIETLQKNNFPYPLDNSGKDPNGTPIYKNAYLYLRSQIRTHISLGTQPELNRLPPPEIPAYHDRMQQIFEPNHEECYG